MSETSQAGDGKIEGSAFLFNKPELLTLDAHGDLGMTRPERPYAFCENVNAVPITISEIAMVQKHYPIIFAENEPLPMAVIGIIENSNLFIDENGEWAENVYIPGYIRRYPFALAGDANSDRMAMIVDTDYKGLAKNGQTPLFDGDKPSAATQQALEYCKNYEQDRLTTVEFAKQFKELGLVTNQVAQFTPDAGGEPKPFAQYFGVEEKTLNDLDDEAFLKMRKSNILPIVYAHLMSMGNWRLLMDRRARKHNLTQENILAPVS